MQRRLRRQVTYACPSRADPVTRWTRHRGGWHARCMSDVTRAVLRARLVGADVDGTLIGRREAVAAATVDALARCDGDGVTVAIISGRPLGSASSFARQVTAPYVIPLNGTAVCHADGRAVWVHHGFERSTLDAFARLAERHSAGLSLDALHTRYAITDVTASMVNMADRHGTTLVPVSVEQITDAALKAQFLGSPDALAHLRRALPPEVVATSGADHHGAFLEVAPGGTSKGDALQRLGTHLTVSREQIMVICDGENDISLCLSAAVTVAVGDAHPGLLALATHHVSLSADDGAAGIALAALLYGDPSALTYVRALRPTRQRATPERPP